MARGGSDLDETTLIERCLEGDREACRSLFKAHDPMVQLVARSMLHDTHEAQDVSQEVFERVFTHLARFRRDASLATWIRRITVHRCLDRLRSRSSTVTLDASGDAQPSIAPGTDTSERRVDLQKALAGLKPEERALVLAAADEASTYDSLGVAFKLGRDEVRGRLYRARKKLKELLQW